MKKVLFTALLATAISVTASAQTRIGGLLGFGSEIESLALGAVGEFMIQDNMGISPQVVFFFGKKEGDFKESLWEINGNFNYYFLQENVDLYGLLGLNIASYKVKYDGPSLPGFSASASDTEIGLNLGLGANFPVSNDSILPFAELKYVISDFDQLCIYAGVKFILP
ncbi:MAG: porin family protein [Cyclobacteriaceae bacterium]|nr:porin family protein [Cyclobacteriaceae bacterium]